MENEYRKPKNKGYKQQNRRPARWRFAIQGTEIAQEQTAGRGDISPLQTGLITDSRKKQKNCNRPQNRAAGIPAFRPE